MNPLSGPLLKRTLFPALDALPVRGPEILAIAAASRVLPAVLELPVPDSWGVQQELVRSLNEDLWSWAAGAPSDDLPARVSTIDSFPVLSSSFLEELESSAMETVVLDGVLATLNAGEMLLDRRNDHVLRCLDAAEEVATFLDELLALPERVAEDSRVTRERRERARTYDLLMGLGEEDAAQAIMMRLREETEDFAGNVASDLRVLLPVNHVLPDVSHASLAQALRTAQEDVLVRFTAMCLCKVLPLIEARTGRRLDERVTKRLRSLEVERESLVEVLEALREILDRPSSDSVCDELGEACSMAAEMVLRAFPFGNGSGIREWADWCSTLILDIHQEFDALLSSVGDGAPIIRRLSNPN
jgi:hypothetical protein